MARFATLCSLAVAGLLAALAVMTVPRGFEAGNLLAARDDPARLSDLRLQGMFDAPTAAREIEAALAERDAELARSFLDLATDRGVPVDPVLAAKAAAASAEQASAGQAAASFARGLVTGIPADAAGLAGTALGDLLVFGDIRDALTQGLRVIRGEPADRVVLGVALAGLAVTAGTYASFGTAAPGRIGASIVKAAGRTGRITAGLARVLRLERTERLVELAGDVGRVEARAGTRAAFESMHLAEEPGDVARLAKLAAAKGGKTRAILKLLGRGAIALSSTLFDLALWAFWAAVNLLGLCAAIKRVTERATSAVIRRRRTRRAERLLAATTPSG